MHVSTRMPASGRPTRAAHECTRTDNDDRAKLGACSRHHCNLGRARVRARVRARERDACRRACVRACTWCSERLLPSVVRCGPWHILEHRRRTHGSSHSSPMRRQEGSSSTEEADAGWLALAHATRATTDACSICSTLSTAGTFVSPFGQSQPTCEEKALGHTAPTYCQDGRRGAR